VGNSLKLISDPIGFIEAGYRKYGLVWRGRAFGYRGVALLGPDANELVFADRAKNFSSAGGWNLVFERVFPRGLMMMDFDEHRLHRRAMGVAFKPAPMKAYLGLLNEGIQQRVMSWLQANRRPGGVADLWFFPAIKQLSLDLAATSFLGMPLGPRATEINRMFVDMLAAAAGVVRVPVPGSAMWKGVKGRAALVELFGREIPRRRQSPDTSLFTALCRATKEDGSLLADQEIIDHTSFLMLAAHDTLTSTITTLVSLLARHPDWQERLREEMLGLGLPVGAHLTYERLDDLRLLEMAFKEAMRLAPPLPVIPRRAVRDFEFMGHRIPAGTQVAVSSLFTHRMPEIWPEPDKFDPMRFTDEAVRGRHKYAWVPYGGGAHMCIGLHFSYMLTKTFFYHLLTTTRLSMAPGYVPRWQMFPYPKPKDGLLIQLERLQPGTAQAALYGGARAPARCPLHQSERAHLAVAGCPAHGISRI
jgi:cytochrome P450